MPQAARNPKLLTTWCRHVLEILYFVVDSRGVDANLEGRYADVDHDAFVKCYTSVVEEYSLLKKNAQYPDISIWEFTQNTFREVQFVHRWIQYEVNNMPHWDHRFLHPDWLGNEEVRWYAAARIAWVEDRVKQGLDPYPNEGRYAELQLDRYELPKSLPLALHHLIDESVILPMELHTVMIATYETHMQFNYAYEILETLARKCKPMTIEHITTPYTQQAMASPDEEHNACPICLADFSPTLDIEAHLEPAVLTNCNHIIGSDCLQQWFREKHNSCPMCRRPLHILGAKPIPLEDLHESAQQSYIAVQQIRQQFADLDSKIDRFVQQEPKDMYGDEAKNLLDGIWAVNQSLYEVVTTSLEGFGTNVQRQFHRVEFLDY